MNTLDKNLRPIARTLSEANRDADYATPLWRCESENVSAMRLLGFMVGILGICMLGAFVAVTFLSWVGVIVW